jgi:lipid-A-disaccharide synthase
MARVAGWRHRAHVIEGDEGKLDAMKAATVALACSGTVTTELALAGAPMVVGYRLGPVTHAILKRLIRTKYITLFNIAAQAFVAPELVQDDCNGAALAREVGSGSTIPACAARRSRRSTPRSTRWAAAARIPPKPPRTRC